MSITRRFRSIFLLVSLGLSPLCMGAKGCQDGLVGEAPMPVDEHDPQTNDEGGADRDAGDIHVPPSAPDSGSDDSSAVDAGVHELLPTSDGGPRKPPVPAIDVYWSRFSYYGDEALTNDDWYTVMPDAELDITPIGSLAGEGPSHAKVMTGEDFRELANALDELRDELTAGISCQGTHQFEIVIDGQKFTQGSILGASPSGGVCDPSGKLAAILGRYPYF